ncbi:MAG: dephospho-CoA kinase [Duodenibacillus sp.]|nr:dephospho-CoA kinase [Duodenibacillus sp.]
MTLIIGLTGGIASGKSAATDIFRSLGVPVVDADEVSRELTGPSGAALPAVAEAFGAEAAGPSGMDRARMRELVFSDPQARRRLEGILHPLIAREVDARLARVEAPYAVLSVPLMVEGGRWLARIARLLVVDAPEEVQIERLVRTRGLAPERARSIIAAQASRARRLAAADDVIDNTAGLEALAAAVRALDARYRQLAQTP